MEPTKHSRFLPVLYTFAVAAIIVVLALPATRWIVRSQVEANLPTPLHPTQNWLPRELGVKEVRANDNAINEAIFRAVSENKSDAALQTAALLMEQRDPRAPQARPDQSFTPLLMSLQNIAYNQSLSAQPYAAFLRHATRNMSVGRTERQTLASNFLSPPASASAVRPKIDRAELLDAMLNFAIMGSTKEPNNAFFPLMKSVVLFAQENDKEAMKALHEAAQCNQYEDYANDEALALNRLAETAFGTQSVVAQVAQAASVLLPHYAQIRGAVRLAVVSAIEEEAAGNIERGMDIRQDILRIGKTMRREVRILIGNLVGVEIQETARVRPGGIPQMAPAKNFQQGEQESQTLRDLYRLASYFEKNEAAYLAELARSEQNKAKVLQTIVDRSRSNSLMGGAPLIRLGSLQYLGAVLLANIFWLALFGGLATFLLSRKSKSLKPALLMVACWFIVVAIYSVINAPNQFGALRNIVLVSTLGNDGMYDTDNEGLFPWFSVLSLAIPVGIAAVACIVSAFSRVPLSLGLLRGLRGLCLPAAATLILLWVPLLGVVAAKETAMKQEYSEYIQHEGRFLAASVDMAWEE
jgi:hypothetical protein